jgi:sugar/nucleoside kinase (ribokinase family)
MKKSSVSTESSQSSRIVGAGLIALDVVVAADEKPRFFAGGSCGNVLAILGFLGWKAQGIGRLNRDATAERVIRDLRRWQVRTDLMHLLPQARPPIIFHKIFRSPDGEARHKFSLRCPYCGEWLPQYKPVPASSIASAAPKLLQADVFFFDRASRATLDLASRFRQAGATIFFEPSGQGDPRLFSEALAVAHIVKYSFDRFSELSEAGVRPPLEIQTLGDEGLRYRTQFSNWASLPAVEITSVVDTAGCGDWTTAGFLFALPRQAGDLRNVSSKELKRALRFGQILAAWNCSFEGARGGMYRTTAAELLQYAEMILDGTIETLAPRRRRPASNRELLRVVCDMCTPTADGTRPQIIALTTSSQRPIVLQRDNVKVRHRDHRTSQSHKLR